MTAEASSYSPSPTDIERVRPKANMLKVSGDGAFATLQGEGVTAGLPAVFLRLQFCNLQCGAQGGWQCDTGYTWDKTREEFWTEPEDWSFSEAAKKIEDAWTEKFNTQYGRRLVVTGGEPLLQQGKIVGLMQNLTNWEVEIETNGTIKPLPELSNCQINCSPKLANSGNHQRRRYRPEVLSHINSLPNSWFKFVVTSVQDFKEIDQIVDECGLSNEKILIMPEGQTESEVAAHAREVHEEVSKRGWNLTFRNQLIWFGPKRRT